MKKDSMSAKDLTLSITVDQSPAEVFDAILNVRGWWSEEIEGNTANVNDSFTYHFQDIHYCQVKLMEVIKDQRVTWFVKYNYFKFTHDKSEWTGTTIRFDISSKNGKTMVVFTHHGLTPAFECYNICSNAWSTYIQQSLFSLITTGQGQPNRSDRAITEDEKRLSSATL